MKHSKIAISIEEQLVKKVDRLVKAKWFANRSQAMQIAITEKLARLEKVQLAEECAKLNKKIEQEMADEGLTYDLEQWPEY